MLPRRRSQTRKRAISRSVARRATSRRKTRTANKIHGLVSMVVVLPRDAGVRPAQLLAPPRRAQLRPPQRDRVARERPPASKCTCKPPWLGTRKVPGCHEGCTDPRQQNDNNGSIRGLTPSGVWKLDVPKGHTLDDRGRFVQLRVRHFRRHLTPTKTLENPGIWIIRNGDPGGRWRASSRATRSRCGGRSCARRGGARSWAGRTPASRGRTTTIDTKP